jgi:hypothetical protein
MRDESDELLQTVLWAFEVVRTNKPAMVRQIAATYAEAQALVASIPKENGSSRPRIVACFERWNHYLAKDDLAGAGWILTAVQERIAERDLRDWMAMKILVDQAVALLPTLKQQLH